MTEEDISESESKPRMGFKTIGTCQISASGQSIRLDILNCPRTSCYDCKMTPYISRKQLADLLQGHRTTVTIYILVPWEESDSQQDKE